MIGDIANWPLKLTSRVAFRLNLLEINRRPRLLLRGTAPRFSGGRYRHSTWQTSEPNIEQKRNNVKTFLVVPQFEFRLTAPKRSLALPDRLGR
jgi:hypothetical protein